MKKAMRGCARLSLVDKRFEPSARRSQISNLEMIKDLENIIMLKKDLVNLSEWESIKYNCNYNNIKFDNLTVNQRVLGSSPSRGAANE